MKRHFNTGSFSLLGKYSLVLKVFVLLVTTMILSLEAMSQLPVVRVRFANPSYNCTGQSYCVEVQFQADVPGQEVFGMNVRFMYDDAVLEFLEMNDFQGGYTKSSPNPPVKTTGPAASAAMFGFTGPMEFINGAMQLTTPGNPLKVPTTGWLTLYSVCFHVDDPTAFAGGSFCPSLVWDLEYDPANGGFLPGDQGVVITIVDPTSAVQSIPVFEQVIQYNWGYDAVPPDPPYGAPTPVPTNCVQRDNVPPVLSAADGSTMVDCVSNATPPMPPTATDACDGIITGVLASVTDTPNPITCDGTRVYTYSYTDNAGNKSYWHYTVKISLPDIPLLLSPSSGTTNQPVNFTLNWNAAARAKSYSVQVSNMSDFSTMVVNQTGLTSTSYNVSGLAKNTKYYWRVRATNTSGTGNWSNVWNFTTVPAVPGVPSLVSPANGATNQPLSLNLSWNTIAGATTYALEVSALSDFSTKIVNQTGLTSTSYMVGGLVNNIKYYWRVRATNTGGTGNWSEVRNFITLVNVYAIPMPDSPDEHFGFYPNPADKMLYFKGMNTEAITLTIYSADGRLLKNVKGEMPEQMDITDLAVGVYLMIIASQDEYISRIFIKQKL